MHSDGLLKVDEMKEAVHVLMEKNRRKFQITVCLMMNRRLVYVWAIFFLRIAISHRKIYVCCLTRDITNNNRNI